MDVILLERIAKLGQMGDVVRVKDGYARNFLLPTGKALRATKENREKFETMKAQLEARNLGLKSEAEKVGKKLDGKSFAVLRQASDTGQLYGSVTARDLAAVIGEGGFTVDRSQIVLNTPIKTIGLHKVPISLHPDSRSGGHRERRAQCRRSRAHRARRGRHDAARGGRGGARIRGGGLLRARGRAAARRGRERTRGIISGREIRVAFDAGRLRL